jgi:cardiolipin synthase
MSISQFQQFDGMRFDPRFDPAFGEDLDGGRAEAAPGTSQVVASQTVDRAREVGRVGGTGQAARAGAAQAPAAPRRAPGPPFGSPEFERLLDSQTNSVTRPNNKLDLLFDGVQSFAERKRLIENAKESILLQTFIFTDDETGWETAHLLADAAQRGVKVRVIYDGLGSSRSDEAIFDFMKKAGVEVREYGDPLRHFWDLNNRWHEKHLIVDGKVGITGGMNIADEYAFGGSGRLALRRPKESQTAWRDADVRIQGPAVADQTAAFLKNWKELGPPVPRREAMRMLQKANEGTVPGGPKARMVQHRPDEDDDQNTHNLYLVAIRSADKSITIENAYFNPPADIRKELIAAARRGVDVKIMTNSKATNDMGAVSDAARYFYDDMIAAGVKIYERQTSTLHSKTASFDGKFSIVGSVNMNGRSEGLDSEIAMATDDPATAKALEKRFAQGIPETKQVTKQELKEEGFFTNLKQWGLSLFSWTF